MASFKGRGGGVWGLVAHCPDICGDRLIYFTKGGEDVNAWVIRDFIIGKELSHTNSNLGVHDVEAKFVLENCESPPRLNARNNRNEWEQYLKDKSIHKFGALDALPPDDTIGTWEPIA